jgi:periplasmic divalent cation tolerance protein
MDLIAVYTTVADERQAELLAKAVIESQLAACVQAEKISSTYRWQGRLEQATEIRLLLKTTRRAYPLLQQLLLELHPYELPAIFAMPLWEAAPAYRQWVEQQIAVN